MMGAPESLFAGTTRCHKVDPTGVIDDAFDRYPRMLDGVYGLLSGGYDSLAACLVAERHPRFAGVFHVHTGIGVPETLDYVIEVARLRGWPLRIYTPEAHNSYEQLVREFGMPGPGFHAIPFRRLKERQMESITRDLKAGKPRLSNVCLVSGARRNESQRRMGNMSEPITKVKARVFVSPIADWSKADCLDEIQRARLPWSDVVATLHKSGECLCGAFGSQEELEELAVFYPDVARRIRGYEALAESLGKPCKWGERPVKRPDKIPLMCQGCGPQLELEVAA